MFANTKSEFNVLEDQIVKDEMTKLLGFQLVCERCMICNDTAIKYPRDHGVSCVARLLAKTIGDQIEDGVQKAINFFEETECQPMISTQLLWEIKDPNDQTNNRGDFRSFRHA